jgi:hypothetical protein
MRIPQVSIWRIVKLLALAGIFFGLIALDGFLIEPNFPFVVHQTVVVPGLPKPLDGLKIVQLSDLHIVRLGKRETRALRTIARIEPDLILLTGDYLGDDGITPGNYSDPFCVTQVARFMKGLHAKHGIFAVPGNWDSLRPTPEYENIGVTWLDGTSATVRIRGVPLLLASTGGVTRQRASRRGELSSPVTIVLDHFPDAAEELSRLDPPVALVVAGHWHGGQVGWPLEMKDVKYLAGLYKVGNTQLYVNRGLGMHSLAVRFNCPSEITLLTLRRG